MGVKVKAPRKDTGVTKEKNQKCGCCPKSFVTLARHYSYTPVYGPGGIAAGPINKPSKCAAWAIKNNIDVKALSIAKSPSKKAGTYKRLGVLRALSTLTGSGVMTVKQAEIFNKKIEEMFPEVEEEEVEEEEEDEEAEEKA